MSSGAVVVDTHLAGLDPAVGRYPDLPTVAVAGSAIDHGSTGGLALNAPIIDLVATASDGGYWLLAEDGGVFTFGDAGFFGSTGDLVLDQPVRAMATTATGAGYWFVAADGGLFAFGDAPYLGSIPAVLPGVRLDAPIVGMTPAPDGRGYWMVASDGGVFAFGSAFFVGSLGGQVIPAPIVAFTPTPSGRGYWMVDVAGRTYPFGDAADVGDAPPLGDLRVTDVMATPSGAGMWVLHDSGLVGRLGDAITYPELFPTVDLGPSQWAVGLDATSDGSGLWVATTGRVRWRGDPDAVRGFALIRPEPDGTGRRWSPCAPITWYFNPAHAPEGGLEMFTDAFEWWVDVTGLPFVYGGTSEVDPSSNRTPGTIVVGWQPTTPPGGWAQPGWVTTPFGRRYVWGWVELDAQQVTSRPVTFRPGGFGGIALHEIGHVVGLDHPDEASFDELMSNAPRGRVGLGDLAGLTRLDARHGC